MENNGIDIKIVNSSAIYEVSRELQNLKKSLESIDISIAKLQERISPILRDEPAIKMFKSEPTFDPSVTKPTTSKLVKLAEEISHLNRLANICNKRIDSTIASCQL